MRRVWVGVLMVAAAASASARDPDCTGPDRYAVRMAEGQLIRKGLLDTAQLDDDKTAVVEISSQRIGKDLYRQVHRIRFYYRNGKTVQVIAINNASHVECSMSGVDVYIVSDRVEEEFEPELVPMR